MAPGRLKRVTQILEKGLGDGCGHKVGKGEKAITV